nr:ankyrin repeat domain-containing protein 28 [Colletotrichum truncatum]KAF6801829.1 ankyrin repeat domain-containing protein 28 [Colletotrichum truncatum]
MAPLGVITAVVSAIRVRGGSSLRAFIGRAQEGGGIAEAELCSSTSRDVCELYNNGAIVRVFGHPKILEIIYDRKASEEEFSRDDPIPSECGIYLSREYLGKRRFGTFDEYEKTAFGTWAKKPSDDDEETQALAPDNAFAPNPNLSFNIGIRRSPEKLTWLGAAVAFLAQASVIVFGGLVTSWGWKKDENVPPRWAFPLMSFGTVALCGGMFYCAFLVETSTEEKMFRRVVSKDNDVDAKEHSSTSTLYVVQPGNQTIGDQTFNSFLFDDSTAPINQYITSRRAPKQVDNQLGVWIAISATIFGFVLQFVGLRAMHSAVSVLQLGVIIIVSLIRAGLRTQRLRNKHNLLHNRSDEVEGHELDWLALQMGKHGKYKDKHFSWVVSSPVSNVDSADNHKNSSEGNGIDHDNSLSKEPDQYSQKDVKVDRETKIASKKSSELGSIARTFHLRSRLAELTSHTRLKKSKSSTAWDDRLVPVRQLAQKLRNAIESSIKILLPKESRSSTESLSWNLFVAEYVCGESSSSTERISLSIPLQGSNEKPEAWDILQRHLEAVLGLWIWSIMSDPRLEERDKFDYRVSKASELRSARIIAIGTTEEMNRARIEIGLWTDDFPTTTERELTAESDRMQRGPDNLWKTQTKKTPDEEQIHNSLETSSSVTSCTNSLLRLFGWQLSTTPSSNCLPTETYALTVNLNHSISTACAHDIYQSFLCAAAEVLDYIEGPVQYSKGSRGFFLEHEVISGLAECFQKSSLGSSEDALSVILPALRYRSKLPPVTAALPRVYNEAEDLRKKKSFKEAEDVLKWAWENAGKMMGEERTAGLEAIMLQFGELYRNALFCKDEAQELFAKKGISWMNEESHKSSHDSLAMISDRYVALWQGEVDKSKQVKAEDIIGPLSRGDRTNTLALISQATELVYRDGDGRTVLSWAAQQGWPEVVKAAIDIGSAIDSEDKDRRTPLSYAAERGHGEIVRILMNNRALPVDSSNRTPLSHASAGGYVAVLGELLPDPRVNIHETDDNGYSALHWAAEKGHEKAIELLLKHKAYIDAFDRNGYTPLIAALLGRQKGVADLLIEEKADHKIKIDSIEAWRWAIREGEWMCAEKLLRLLNKEDQNSTSSIKRRRAIVLKLTHRDLPLRVREDSPVQVPESVLSTCIIDENGRQASISADSVQLAVDNRYYVNIWLYEVSEGGQTWKSLDFNNERLIKIVGWLLSEGGEQVKITQDIVEAAARDTEFGEELMKLLLEERGDEITITEEVVKAAVGNQAYGESIFRLLLEKRGEIAITEEVVKAAVGNQAYGEPIFRLLLEKRGEIAITEEVVKAAIGNQAYGEPIFRLLLEERGDKIAITEEVVKAAVGNQAYGEPIFRLLLRERGDEIAITEEVVKAAVGNQAYGESIFRLLLEERGDEITITEEVVKAAVGNQAYGESIFRLLLEERGDEITITEEVVKAAVGNQGYGESILRLLLEERGDKIAITEEVVKAAVGNQVDGKSILRLLLEERGDKIAITEEVVKAAVGNQAYGESIFRLLLEERGDEITITEEVVKAAVGNQVDGKSILRLLLEERGVEVTITGDVIEAAAMNSMSGKRIMESLLSGKAEIKVSHKLVEVLARTFEEDWMQSIWLMWSQPSEDSQEAREDMVREAILRRFAGSQEERDMKRPPTHFLSAWP